LLNWFQETGPLPETDTEQPGRRITVTWDYTEKVKDHFFNPRNAGELPGANAVGDVGSISCGDALRLMLKVDAGSETILDAGFQTFGCGSAIASSSALTEIVKGMTLDQARAVTNQDIADYLDGLPPEKMHCSVMGREALHAAIADFRGEAADGHDEDEGALVCKCFGIHAGLVEEVVRDHGLRSLEDVTNYTKAGGSCGCCHEAIEDLLQSLNAAAPDTPEPVPLRAAAEPAPAMTELQRVRAIEAVIAEMRPMVQRDGGDLELVDVDGKTVFVRLLGACTGCHLAGSTLSALQQRLMERLGGFVRLRTVEAAPRAAGMEG